MQYPQRSRHSMVSGMKTLGEYVTLAPWARSRMERAWAANSTVSSKRSTRSASGVMIAPR